MNRQEIYEYVGERLLNQGHRSMVGEMCSYRGLCGDRCAIGWLLSEESYNLGMEGKSFNQLMDKYGDCLPPYFRHEFVFLEELQTLHDRKTYWVDFRQSLVDFGKNRGLDTSKFEES